MATGASAPSDGSTTATEHYLPADESTVRVGRFDRDDEPVLIVNSGDAVVTATLNHWADGITPASTLEDAIWLRTEVYRDVGPHSITGPIAVRGSKAGEVLRVDILELQPRRHGYTLSYPGAMGFGLLPADFPNGFLRHYDLDLEQLTTELRPGVKIPLRPFLGIMGVAPPDPGPHSSVPPGRFGGNVDLSELVVGSTLYLPIWRDEANFYVGDAHAAQGNGEVCLTAIETAMERVRLRLTVCDGFELPTPWAETSESIITMGYDVDLRTAAEQATRNMVRLLGHQHDLDPDDAYALCSVAADLSMTQVVNQTSGVHCSVKQSLFSDATSQPKATGEDSDCSNVPTLRQQPKAADSCDADQ